MILVEFLALVRTQRLDQLLQLALEDLHLLATGLDLEVGLVQGFARRLDVFYTHGDFPICMPDNL